MSSAEQPHVATDFHTADPYLHYHESAAEQQSSRPSRAVSTFWEVINAEKLLLLEHLLSAVQGSGSVLFKSVSPWPLSHIPPPFKDEVT